MGSVPSRTGRVRDGTIAGSTWPDVVALLGSGWLTYLEAARIHAWCQWCVGSAIVMTLLTVVLVWRLLAAPVHSDNGPAADVAPG